MSGVGCQVSGFGTVSPSVIPAKELTPAVVSRAGIQSGPSASVARGERATSSPKRSYALPASFNTLLRHRITRSIFGFERCGISGNNFSARTLIPVISEA